MVMNPLLNLLAPNAGDRASGLAGRADVLRFAMKQCSRLLRRRSGRPIMLLGLRGAGKSALLNEIGRRAAETGWLVSGIESPGSDSLSVRLHSQMQKVFCALSAEESAAAAAGAEDGATIGRGLSALQCFAAAFRFEAAPPVGIPVAPLEAIDASGILELDLP